MQAIDFDIEKIIAHSSMIEPLQTFSALLLQWAKIHNLTGAKTQRDITKQIHNSLMPLAFLQPFTTCIDIGSGAGFPALILACYYRESMFYLLEPRKKRASFLENAIIAMGLCNARVIADYSYNVRNIQGDLITSRGVCKSDILIESSKHLLTHNGFYLLYKGTNTTNEAHNLSMPMQIFTYKQCAYVYAHNKT